MKVLSTKNLTGSQQSLFPSNFEVIEKPLIQIEFGKGLEVDQTVIHAIFTSANAVKSVFGENKINADLFENVYCVGLKTKALLESFGVTVLEVAENALELADILVPKKIQDIHFFCGNLRNNDLPKVMAENCVLVTEYMVYKTELYPHSFDEVFDAVLFFSPSGVTSYAKANNNKNVKAICIGITTATEALDVFEEVYIADTTSVESVIEKIIDVQST